MRLSLVLHQKTCRLDGRSNLAYLPMGTADVQRDQAAAAAETVALVLDEESPLPENASDVEELARRLRGHISQLGTVAPPRAPELLGAQQVASADVPGGYVPSRVHLVKLAEATRVLIAAVQVLGSAAPSKSTRKWRGWKPRVNALRGSVAVAFALLVLAASVPRA
ncbi:DUF6415 family natural product biosynthesis protein [Streptomyces sp. NPDC006978]|uniref:DUF6415 family natural product biosynthesis protein n=1 Tax=Streptomyces sp. NPDC006978 TaxID=3364769 RepID=UPI0036A5FB5B